MTVITAAVAVFFLLIFACAKSFPVGPRGSNYLPRNGDDHKPSSPRVQPIPDNVTASANIMMTVHQSKSINPKSSFNNDSKLVHFVLELSEKEFREMQSNTTLRKRRVYRLKKFMYNRWFRFRDYFSMRRLKMTAYERNIFKVYKRTFPSVAELVVHKILVDDSENGNGGFANGRGSGVLWDNQGHIVTNHHVIFKQEWHPLKVKVRFPGMVDFLDADVVGSLEASDLAVLKVSPKQRNPALEKPLKMLPKPIRKGSSKTLQVGQTCLAMGSPNVFATSLSVGIVSDLGLTVDVGCSARFRGCIQTTAILFNGYSGGPLLDNKGQLIGINFAGSEERSMAIPIDTVKNFVNQIIQNGHVEAVTIGVSFLKPSIQEKLEFKRGVPYCSGGAMIQQVCDNSPGEKAGLQGCVIVCHTQNDESDWDVEPRDIVVAADGKQVRDSDQIFAIFNEKMPGDKILLTVSRVARIGDLDRWTEVIPVEVISANQLYEVSEEYRKTENKTNGA